MSHTLPHQFWVVAAAADDINVCVSKYLWLDYKTPLPCSMSKTMFCRLQQAQADGLTAWHDLAQQNPEMAPYMSAGG